jgi:hypothetical protein
MFLEDGLCVRDFVREEMIKPNSGLLEDVHDLVVTRGHCRRRRRRRRRRPLNSKAQ